MKSDEQLIDDFMCGIDEKRYTSVLFRGKRVVLFKVAGHRYWSSVTDPAAYAKVEFILTRIDHYIVVCGRKIYDNKHPDGVSIRQYPHRRIELVCEGCSQSLTGQHTYGVIPRAAMKKDALKAGWKCIDQNWFCRKCVALGRPEKGWDEVVL